MKALYIGQYQSGNTSKMRADIIRKMLNEWQTEIIDTQIPFQRSKHWEQSLAFRWKRGPLIRAMNQYIRSGVRSNYDLIWVDKGIYLQQKTMSTLREAAKQLIHYTPDAAFLRNRSHLFEKSIPYYDHLITTKSFEVNRYRAYHPNNLILTTQGYDPFVHKTWSKFQDKSRDIVFIGLCEPHRKRLVQGMLDAEVHIGVGGKGWSGFVSKNKKKNCLEFLGDNIYGKNYAQLLSSSRLGLGLLSKYFPEKHTTRTLEIPACGSALLTERNEETTRFFNEDEAFFYDDDRDLPNLIKDLLGDPAHLLEVTRKGTQKVMDGPFSYEKIIHNLLKETKILE